MKGFNKFKFMRAVFFAVLVLFSPQNISLNVYDNGGYILCEPEESNHSPDYLYEYEELGDEPDEIYEIPQYYAEPLYDEHLDEAYLDEEQLDDEHAEPFDITPLMGITVTFDPNGGETPAGHDTRDTTTGDSGGGTVGVANMPMPPTLDGFHFMHWNTRQDGTGDLFTGTTPVIAPITVYAQWGAETVFNLNGPTPPTGTNPNNPAHFVRRIVPVGATVNDTPNIVWPNDPTWPGFYFRGWFDTLEPPFDTHEPPPAGTEFFADTPIMHSVLLFAWWERRQILTVTFDVAGGILHPDHINTRQAVRGLSISASTISPHHQNPSILFPRAAPSVTRAGMTLEGWWTGPYGSGERFAPPGGTGSTAFANTPVDDDITVYANWVFRVSFNPNWFGDTVITTRDVPIDPLGSVGDAMPPNPSRPDYAFLGWFLSPGASDEFTRDTTVSASKTVFAHWERVTPLPDTATVTFDPAGGIFTEAYRTVHVGETIREHTGVSMPGFPTRDGYTFMGWYPEGSAERFTQDTPLYDDITVFAAWRANAHTLTFLPNGGTADPQTRMVPAGFTVTQINTIWTSTGGGSFSLPSVSRTGHVFLGWNTLSDGDGAVFAAATPISSDMTLYAMWRGTITFNNNHPGAITNATVTRQIANGRNFLDNHLHQNTPAARQTWPTTAPTSPGFWHWPQLNFTGFAFLGFFENADGTGAQFTRETPVYGSQIVYAIWRPGIAFHPGIAPYDAIDPADRHRDVPIGSPIGDMPTPVWAGREFLGWNTQQDGMGTSYLPTTIFRVSRVLYATWAARVTFNASGGIFSAPGDYEREAVIVTGSPIQHELPANPTRAGWNFAGWFDGNVRYVEFVTPILQSMTLNAGWEAEITFDLNGGNIGGNTAAVIRTVPEGGTVPTLPVPTRVGHTFAGWTWSGGAFDTATVITGGHATVTAVWGTSHYEATIANFPADLVPAGQSPNRGTHSIAYGTEISLTAGAVPGWTFLGWTTETAIVANTPVAGLALISPSPGFTHTMGADDITITAVWGNQDGIIGVPNDYTVTIVNRVNGTEQAGWTYSGTFIYGELVAVGETVAAAFAYNRVYGVTPGISFGIFNEPSSVGAGLTEGDFPRVIPDEAQLISPFGNERPAYFFRMPDGNVTLVFEWTHLPGGVVITTNATGNSFGLLPLGYDAELVENSHTITVTVTNNFDFTVYGARARIGAGFEIAGSKLPDDLPPGGSGTFLVRPELGHTPGIYVGLIEVHREAGGEEAVLSVLSVTLTVQGFTVSVINAPDYPAVYGQAMLGTNGYPDALTGPLFGINSEITITPGNRDGYEFHGWSSPQNVNIATDENGVATFSMSAENVYVTAGWRNIFSAIELDPPDCHDFGRARVRFHEQEPHSVTVRNIGYNSVGPLSVSLSGQAESFVVYPSEIETLAPDDEAVFTVVPRVGLLAGRHTATVTVHDANGISEYFTVRFTVTRTTSGSWIFPHFPFVNRDLPPIEPPEPEPDEPPPEPDEPPESVNDDPPEPLLPRRRITHRAFIRGYPDGTVRADSPANRAQVVQMMFNLPEDEDKYRAAFYGFPDVRRSIWHFTPISYFAAKGDLVGFPDGNFHPYNYMTYAEFATFFASTFNIAPTGEGARFDGHWAQPYLNLGFERGWFSGRMFNPDAPISRAHVIALLVRYTGRVPVPHSINAYLDNRHLFKDLRRFHPQFYNIMTAAITHQVYETGGEWVYAESQVLGGAAPEPPQGDRSP